MRQVLLIFAFALFALPSLAQKIDCSEFKIGSFILPKTELIPASFRITRTETEQVEEVLDVPDSLAQYFPTGKHYGSIRWVSPCSYILHYDSTKMDLDETMKEINKEGGLTVTITSIEGNCAKYEASSLVNGQVFSVSAKICKTSD